MRITSTLCFLGLFTLLWPLATSEAQNHSPTLHPIGPTTVVVGDTLNLVITASDPDGDSLVFSITNRPDNSEFTDYGNDTASFVFYPDSAQIGIHFVLFAVNDGYSQDVELVPFTVDTTNQAPILAPIGSQSLMEGDTLSLRVSAIDPDRTQPNLRAENLPINATFVDSGGGVGGFTFLPDFLQAGDHFVTFIATDGSLADSEVVNIAVAEAGNQSPSLAFIDTQGVREGITLSLGVNATDPDEDSISLTAEDLPENATFTDNGAGFGTFVFLPDAGQIGLHCVTFIASDGSLADTQDVFIIVEANLAPELVHIDSQSVVEGTVLFFWVRASDPNEDAIVLTAEGLPDSADFVDNGAGVGRFTYRPDSNQIGFHDVIFIASDGDLADTQVVTIEVQEANEAPELAAIEQQMVVEGEVLTFQVKAVDADGDSITLSASNLPPNASFVDSGSGVGGFQFAPDTTQAGVYQVTFTASDGLFEDEEAVRIVVASNVDTFRVADTTAGAGHEVAVPVLFTNTVWVAGLNLRVEYDTTYLTARGVDLTGTRLHGRYTFTQSNVSFPGVVTFTGLSELFPDEIPNEFQHLPPGSGPVVYVLFDVDSEAQAGEELIRLAEDHSSPQPDNSFADTLASALIVPALVDGRLTIKTNDVPDSEHDGDLLPQTFSLESCYPNPFNSTVVLPYNVPSVKGGDSEGRGALTLNIYNVAGQVVRTLVNGPQSPGRHRAIWDGRDDRGHQVASGLYIYRLISGEIAISGKAVLLR